MPLSFQHYLFSGPTVFSDCVRKLIKTSRGGQDGEVNKACKTLVLPVNPDLR